jgi:hypothetical protein
LKVYKHRRAELKGCSFFNIRREKQFVPGHDYIMSGGNYASRPALLNTVTTSHMCLFST